MKRDLLDLAVEDNWMECKKMKCRWLKIHCVLRQDKKHVGWDKKPQGHRYVECEDCDQGRGIRGELADELIFCFVLGCEETRSIQGLCHSHYNKWRNGKLKHPFRGLWKGGMEREPEVKMEKESKTQKVEKPQKMAGNIGNGTGLDYSKLEAILFARWEFFKPLLERAAFEQMRTLEAQICHWAIAAAKGE